MKTDYTQVRWPRIRITCGRVLPGCAAWCCCAVLANALFAWSCRPELALESQLPRPTGMAKETAMKAVKRPKTRAKARTRATVSARPNPQPGLEPELEQEAGPVARSLVVRSLATWSRTTIANAPGLTFCLSGTLSMKKADVEKLIKANGGKISGSVTAAVTHVVAADPSTGKATQAQEKGLNFRTGMSVCAHVLVDHWLNCVHRAARGAGVVHTSVH